MFNHIILLDTDFSGVVPSPFVFPSQYLLPSDLDEEDARSKPSFSRTVLSSMAQFHSHLLLATSTSSPMFCQLHT